MIGQAANGREALLQVQRHDPDVVLMDLRMPEMGGVDTIHELQRRGHRAKVLVLTTYDRDDDIVPAIEAGATGYLLKDTPRDDLFRAVRAASRGEATVKTHLVRAYDKLGVSDRTAAVVTALERGLIALDPDATS